MATTLLAADGPSPGIAALQLANAVVWSYLAFIFLPTLRNGDSPFVATADAKLQVLFDDQSGLLTPGGGLLRAGESPAEQHLIDLGSGDGAVVRAATRVGGYGRASGYEINPGLVRIAKLRSTGRANENFYEQSLWEAPLADADVVVIYCLPRFLEELGLKLGQQLREGALVISNAYPLPLESAPQLRLVREVPVETPFWSQDKSSSLWCYRVSRSE